MFERTKSQELRAKSLLRDLFAGCCEGLGGEGISWNVKIRGGCYV
jgi:hypothetical protein